MVSLRLRIQIAICSGRASALRDQAELMSLDQYSSDLWQMNISNARVGTLRRRSSFDPHIARCHYHRQVCFEKMDGRNIPELSGATRSDCKAVCDRTRPSIVDTASKIRLFVFAVWPLSPIVECCRTDEPFDNLIRFGSRRDTGQDVPESHAHSYPHNQNY